MKRVFFFGVIVYSGMILLLNDWPAAAGYTGTAALPFMVKCLVDVCFIGLGGFKLFGDQIHFDDEEVGVHPDDVSVPDTWLYGVFGLNLLGNFGWHGYQFANTTGAESFYNSLWWFIEFAAMFLTFVLYKHAAQVARREARKAMASRGSTEAVDTVIPTRR
jgi:hypothetical protein